MELLNLGHVLQIGHSSVQLTTAPLLQTGTPGFWPATGEYPLYDAFHYDLMTGDEARNKLYNKAIDSLAPSKIIADLGTGVDAPWAIRAARAGAKHVFAIESDKSAFELAKQSIAQADLESKITLLHATVPDIAIPKKVDSIISEFIGEVANSAKNAPILCSATRPPSYPDGMIIPASARPRRLWPNSASNSETPRVLASRLFHTSNRDENLRNPRSTCATHSKANPPYFAHYPRNSRSSSCNSILPTNPRSRAGPHSAPESQSRPEPTVSSLRLSFAAYALKNRHAHWSQRTGLQRSYRSKMGASPSTVR